MKFHKIATVCFFIFFLFFLTQPVPSQVGADTTRPQWRIFHASFSSIWLIELLWADQNNLKEREICIEWITKYWRKPTKKNLTKNSTIMQSMCVCLKIKGLLFLIFHLSSSFSSKINQGMVPSSIVDNQPFAFNLKTGNIETRFWWRMFFLTSTSSD